MAKKPRASSRGRGVYLIENQAQLDAYMAEHKVAYIQERLPISRDLRVVVIGFKPVCAYWRVPPPGEWRSNVAQGAGVQFEGVPPQAVELAVDLAKAADLDEVGILTWPWWTAGRFC